MTISIEIIGFEIQFRTLFAKTGTLARMQGTRQDKCARKDQEINSTMEDKHIPARLLVYKVFYRMRE